MTDTERKEVELKPDDVIAFAVSIYESQGYPKNSFEMLDRELSRRFILQAEHLIKCGYAKFGKDNNQCETIAGSSFKFLSNKEEDIYTFEDGKPIGKDNSGMVAMDKKEVNLIGEFNAQVWAREFMKTVDGKRADFINEGLMIAWFANAIMAGYDKKKDLNRTELLETLGGVYTKDKHAKKVLDSELMVDIADAICSKFSQQPPKERKVSLEEIKIIKSVLDYYNLTEDGFYTDVISEEIAKRLNAS